MSEPIHFETVAAPDVRIGAREPAIVRMPVSALVRNGIGLGLGQTNEAMIGDDQAKRMFRLIDVQLDPAGEVAITHWTPASQPAA